jgi:hypothetical protein
MFAGMANSKSSNGTIDRSESEYTESAIARIDTGRADCEIWTGAGDVVFAQKGVGMIFPGSRRTVAQKARPMYKQSRTNDLDFEQPCSKSRSLQNYRNRMNRQIAKGQRRYSDKQEQVRVEGLSFSSAEIQAALGDSVSAAIFDDEGVVLAQSTLDGVAATDFETQQLNEILSQPVVLKDWQVGEAIAQVWLTEHRNCAFPWPASRDLRNRNASPAGADLVGFRRHLNSYWLAFGEVKTSSENKYPPQVVTSRHGVVKQLETLRDDHLAKNQLFLYLAHRAQQSDWSEQFKQAARNFLQNKSAVVLFGVLVRDVVPNAQDLQGRMPHLAKGCPTETSIELLAFYLPSGTISTMAQQVNQQRNARR